MGSNVNEGRSIQENTCIAPREFVPKQLGTLNFRGLVRKLMAGT